MLNMLMSLVDMITTLFNFIVSTIASILALITNIPSYVAFIVSSVNVLPSFIIPFAVAFVTLIVVQYIANRRVDY